MTRAEVLNSAIKQVTGKRVTDYGKPENTFGTIAALWSDYLDVDVSSKDVCMMMALMKIARIKGDRATEDSFVDLAGYAACGAEVYSKSVDELGDESSVESIGGSSSGADDRKRWDWHDSATFQTISTRQ